MSDELNWGDIEKKEKVTEDEIKNADRGGQMPMGKYLCVVRESKPVRIDPKGKDSYFAANLKHEIESVVELNGKPVNSDEGDMYIGRFIWDKVSLAHDAEKDAVRNRRIAIVKRAGIISESSSEIPENTWSELIIGKKFLLTVEDNEYEKDGKTIKGTKVAMFGYETPEAAEKVSESDIDDI